MSIFQKIRNLDKNILGINRRNAELVYPKNPREHFPLADDKILTKGVLEKHSIACAETYAVISRVGDIARVWDTMHKYPILCVKPACGSGGGGIKVIRQNEKGQWISSGKVMTLPEIYRHLANIMMGVYSFGSSDRVLIERCIVPHSFFQTIYPEGVPDYRVILLHSRPLMAMLRVPTDQSDGKANLHQGGLGIGIDMETGKLTLGFDGDRYYKKHPDTRQQIFGREIPYWKEILELSIETSKAFPLHYLGIDIVVDETSGPLIMEINVRPGLGIQIVNQKGLREVIAA